VNDKLGRLGSGEWTSVDVVYPDLMRAVSVAPKKDIKMWF